MRFLPAFLFASALLAQPDYQAEGIKALDAKNYTQALDLFKKSVAADPKDFAAHFYVGLAYSMLEQYKDAVPEYRTVLDLKPRSFEAELNLGICLMHLKDPAAAAPLLKDATEQRPKEYRPAFYYAQSLLDQNQFIDAERAFTTALALDGKSPAAELGLAQSLTGQAKLAESEPHFRKAGVLDPAYATEILQLGQLYEASKQFSEAIAIYQGFPDNPGVEARLGNLLLITGSVNAAIPALESALAKSPTAANRVALAQAYLDNKQPDKAIPLVTQALAAEPNDYDLHMFLGKLLRDQRKFNEAAPQFLAASKIKPAEVQPWNEIVSLMVVSEQYPQALAALDRVQALGGETTFHLYLRAISYDHLRQLKEALANYNKYLEQSQGKSPNEEFKARQRARIIQNELNKR